ncbi:hypothetical protein PTKIN_Ptkin15bG0154700 [Pterospermum kingtungense]
MEIPIPIGLMSSSYFLKPVTKILVPFLVLSVVLSYPLLSNFDVFAYGLSQLFSFSIGKNYMFLLCNGLVVFIATSSGLIGGLSVETDFKAEKTMKTKGGSQRELQVESSEHKGSIIAKVDEESGESKMDSLALVHVEGEEQRNELVSLEEDEDEGFGSMSKEELKKKCDDFIRKMKTGIKFEAQQLITVQ